MSAPEKIGLLFVHGIGEQKRFEFLSNSVREFAELMKAADGAARINIIDRTEGWALPPGKPDAVSEAPITMVYQTANEYIHFECHEVWWADLGCRSGLADTLKFWFWGLGQWNAPIYQDLDFANVAKPGIATMPASAAGRWLVEPMVRARLMLAALAALFTLLGWSIAKRLFAKIMDQAPSPSLIVQYVGDVRNYERRATPGNSALSDPGFPMRVGIRRRMVTEMVAMASRKLDGWYVVSHSLGTVVAYNGLTEIGHTLPNYLPKAQWTALPLRMKVDPGAMKRDNFAAMMPARPDWLQPKHALNRPMLFARLRGFLTYGSPLDKFAALWPRIVATGTDRVSSDNPFPDDCRWINLAAPNDPVAGKLDSFGTKSVLKNVLPKLENYHTPLGLKFVLAHILYFTGAERFVRGVAIDQKRAVVGWLINRGNAAISSPSLVANGLFGWKMALIVSLVYTAITAVLGLIVVALVAAGGGLLAALFQGEPLVSVEALSSGFARWCFPVFGLSLVIILICGLGRWIDESWLNLKLAKSDGKSSRIIGLLRTQFWAGIIVAAAVVVPVIGALAADFAPPQCIAAIWIPSVLPFVHPGSAAFAVAVMGGGSAIVAQTAINAILGK